MMNFSLGDIIGFMFSKRAGASSTPKQSEASKKTHLQRAAEKRVRKGVMLNVRADRGDIGRIGDPPHALTGEATAWPTPASVDVPADAAVYHHGGPAGLRDGEVAVELTHNNTKRIAIIAHGGNGRAAAAAVAALNNKHATVDIQRAMETPPRPIAFYVPDGTSNKEAAHILYDMLTSPETDASQKIAAAHQLVALRKTAKVSFDRLGLPEDTKSRVAVLLEA